MRNFLHIQEAAARAIAAKAGELSIQGVATALVWDPSNPTFWTPTVHVVGRLSRGPKPERGPDDIGANYGAVALAKLAQMLRTKCPSGQIALKGENDYPGGDLVEMTEAGLFLFASFSGGTGAQDLEAAQEGLAVLRDRLANQVIPSVEHVSLWILHDMELALSFFKHLGWVEEENRHPTWEGGEARFVRHPMGGAYLQLTRDEEAIPGEEGSAFHVAMPHPVN